jgi:hypothetical protein
MTAIKIIPYDSDEWQAILNENAYKRNRSLDNLNSNTYYLMMISATNLLLKNHDLVFAANVKISNKGG